MKKLLFVCHGNICRSPMAEFVMKKIARDAAAEGVLHIESAATSSEEIGNAVYPPAVRELARHGICCEGKRARRITSADFLHYDMIIVMEEYNIRNMRSLPVGGGKVWKLLDFAGCCEKGEATPLSGGDISDPWYHGDFSAPVGGGKVWKLLDFAGCCEKGEVTPLSGGDISDPWYHGDFSATYEEIERGCKGLFKYLGF